MVCLIYSDKTTKGNDKTLVSRIGSDFFLYVKWVITKLITMSNWLLTVTVLTYRVRVEKLKRKQS